MTKPEKPFKTSVDFPKQIPLNQPYLNKPKTDRQWTLNKSWINPIQSRIHSEPIVIKTLKQP